MKSSSIGLIKNSQITSTIGGGNSTKACKGSKFPIFAIDMEKKSGKKEFSEMKYLSHI